MAILQERKIMAMILFVYVASYFLQSIVPMQIVNVQAETPMQDIHLVALFVDEKLYNNSAIQDDIDRYAQQYIQQQQSNTKALILPIDTQGVQAVDIVRILENLYFEGERDTASTLDGVILIGQDIPLPVVQDDGYIFPTIFPYVDFEEQRYVRDNQTQYFLPNDNQTSEPEIWHGAIFLGNDPSAYTDYFAKLRTYDQDKTNYIGRNIWYDDFQAYKQTFNANILGYYLNNFVFAEDIAYKRFHSLLFTLFNDDHNEAIQELFAGDIQVQSGSIYQDGTNQFNAIMSAQQSIPSAEITDVPTRLIEPTLRNFFKSYKELFGSSYLQGLRDNVLAGARRGINDIDTHSDVITLQDSLYYATSDNNPLFVQYNTILQNALIQEVKKQEYAMHVPVLTYYKEYKNQILNDENNLNCRKPWYFLDGEYENYYFGRNTHDINNVEELSFYRGTYQNFTTKNEVKSYDYTNNGVASGLITKSIGGSYGVLSQQIEANRGYNFTLTQQDIDDQQVQEDNKSQTACNDRAAYIEGYWGGNTPLNLGTGAAGQLALKFSNFQTPWNPTFNRAIGGWLFDMAGARKVSQEQSDAHDWRALSTYSNVQRFKVQEAATVSLPGALGTVVAALAVFQPPILPAKTLQACDVSNRRRIPYQNIDYFTIMDSFGEVEGYERTVHLITGTKTDTQNPVLLAQASTSRRCDIIQTDGFPVGGEFKAKQLYEYKTIDSTLVHDAPNPEQFNAMSQFTTLDSPIDSIRYMNFQGVHGETITLEFPNLYHVQVYEQDQAGLTLKSPEQIEKSIETYLQQKVQEYNTQLFDALTQRNSYFAAHATGFDLLSQANPLATPNRGYQLLDENFFVDMMPQSLRSEFAQVLYTQNSPWQTRLSASNAVDDIALIKDSADLNRKIKHVVHEYLQVKETDPLLALPGYKKEGYEVAYINSDGSDYLSYENVPTVIQQNLDKQLDFAIQADKAQPEDRGNDQIQCGIPSDGAVPLIANDNETDWFQALQCWIDYTTSRPFKIEVTFKDAQGPVLVIDQLKNIINEYSKPVLDGTHENLETYPSQWEQALKDQQENDAIVNSSTPQAKSLQDVLTHVHPSISSQVLFLEPVAGQVQTPFIQWRSTKDVGDISVRMRTQGDNCLAVNGQNLCDTPYELTFNPYTQEQVIQTNLVGTSAGTMNILYDMCQSDTCVKKSETIRIAPGAVNDIQITFPYDRLLVTAQMPVTINAYDRFGNEIGEQLDRYQITTTKGTINAKIAPQEFRSFDDAIMLYQAPNEQTPVSLTVSPIGNSDLPSKTVNFNVVQGALEITDTVTTQPATQVTYALPDRYDEIYFREIGDIQNINKDAIPRLRLSLRDSQGLPLDAVATLSLENGLIEPGDFSTDYKTVSASVAGVETIIPVNVFKQTNAVAIVGGIAEIALMPQMRTGNDRLFVTIPGSEPIVIPIQIQPGSPSIVQAQTENLSQEIGQTAEVDVRITDIWDNTIPQNIELDIRTLGSLIYEGNSPLIVQNGQTSIQVTGKNPGGRGYLLASIATQPFNEQLPGMLAFSIKNSFIPVDNLNVMYMNLFGTDWGNQRGYFSHTGSIANAMIQQSPKMLAVTTQLIEPTKLLQFSTTLDQFARIQTPGDEQIRMKLRGNKLMVEQTGNQFGISLGDLTDFTLEQRQTIQGVDVNTANTPTIFYVPHIPDASITQNIVQGQQILINGQSAFDLNNATTNLTIQLTKAYHQASNVWSVYQESTKLGDIVVRRNDEKIIDEIPHARTVEGYGVTRHFGGGSTNGTQAVGVYVQSQPGEAKGYDSIEASVDYTKNIGFRNSFENITAFAGGNTVGDATKGFASPWLINLGDPLLKRIDENSLKNEAAYDAGPGQVIHTDAQSPIKKVIHGDLNDDDLVDIVTFYQDGRVQWLKNYGGHRPLKPMGDLLRIAEQIDDAWIGDVDGNGYKDIVIKTTNDHIRVYKNDNVVFAIDGFPVCLDNGGSPHSLATVEQLFLEDMDLDGALDMVLNTHAGEIKIIYGGSTGSGDTYVSNQTIGCDSQWRQRQEDDILLIRQYGSTIDETLKVVDSSLIRTQGLNATDELTAIQNTDVGNNLPLVDPQNGLDVSTFDPTGIIEDNAGSILKWSVSPVPIVPVYETLPLEDIRYIAVNQLEATDAAQVYKTYKDRDGGTLLSGDIVDITITIQAPANEKLTYIDLPQGPWDIAIDNNEYVTSFDPQTLNEDHIYKPLPASEYLFMIDNIIMDASGQHTFSYEVTYTGGPLVRIDVEDVNEDTYPDIKIYPLDGCVQYRWDLENQVDANVAFRSYEEKEEDLGSTLNNFVNTQQQNTQNHLGDMTNTISSVVSDQSVEQLGDVTSLANQWSLDGIFDDFIANNGEINLGNIDLNLFADQTEVINDVLDQALGGLCQGFSLEKSSCSGLPVPFNMAFLTPGEFNIFGCKPNFPTVNRFFPDDKGFPVFWFPGTQQTSVGPIPFPRGPQMLSQVDDFGYGFPSEGGVYPSQVRVYVSPTLTLGVGLAICVGPQAGFNNIPSPFQDVAGNCVVLSIPAPTICDGQQDQGISEDLYEAIDGDGCPIPPVTPSAPGDKASSPWTLTVAEPGQSARPPIANGTYFGILQFEASPNLRRPGELTSGGVDLHAGKDVKAQVQGGMQAIKGIVKCIINDWMDKQIRYVLNNLTNMTVGVYLPDVTDLLQGFDQLSIQDFGKKQSALEKAQSNVNANADYKAGDVLGNIGSAAMRATWLQKGKLRELSDGASNPFTAVSEMFEAVPLVNINTRDINIIVPMINSEDIRAYTTYLKGYLEENQKRLTEREGLLQGVMGLCGQELSLEQIKNGANLAQAEAIANDIKDFDMKEEVKKLSKKVVGKFDNINKQVKDIKKDCSSDPAGASDCLDSLSDEAIETLNNLDRYAQVNNQCMSFLFGNSIDGGFNTNVVNPNLENFLSFEVNARTVMRQVRQNLRILEQYRQYPFQLYEWVHVWDRYLSELSATIDSFFGSLMQWLQRNANRFEKWVDAIVTLIGVIKSWQAIIDLSVNRSSQCSKCTNDNYDNYACKLSGLCVDLPILPIPPFKIPSIFIDLSHLDLGVDLLLPEFNFVPTSVPLPNLPDLPGPPQVNIDINFDLQLPDVQRENEIQFFAEFTLNLNRGLDIGSLSLPSIPLLPEPPQLPPLPSFLPTLELELPLLPPAPKIPNLSPEITTVLDIAGVVSQIYCIIKGGIGLVGEQGVKTRIEQMTQRSWSVPFFDFIDITQFSRENPLRGFDRKLDAYVSFNYNFTYVFDLLDGFAQVANDTINTTILDPVNQGMDEFNKKANELTQPFQDFGAQNIDLNLNVPITIPTGGSGTNTSRHWDMFKGKELVQYFDEELWKRHTTLVEPIVVYQELVHGLQVLQTSELVQRAPISTQSAVDKTLALLQTDKKVQPNYVGVQSVQTQVQNVVQGVQAQVNNHKNTIQDDYDGFLDDIHEGIVLVNDISQDVAFETPLFLGEESITKTIREQEHPMVSYIDLQKEMLDGFANALTSHTPAALNMSAQTHQKLQGEVSYLQGGIQILNDVLHEEIDTLETLESRLYQAKQKGRSLSPVQRKSLEYALQSNLSCPIGEGGTDTQYEHNTSKTHDLQVNVQDQSSIFSSYVPSYEKAFETQISQFAQLGGGNNAPSADDSNIMQYIDFKQYLNGIYIKGDQRYINVVNSAHHANAVDKNYFIADMTDSGTGDLVMRTQDTIYIKYAMQDDTVGDEQDLLYYTQLYRFPVINTIQNLAVSTQNTQGYLSRQGSEFKIYSPHHEVKNFKVVGQNVEGITYAWQNSHTQVEQVDGYLIKIVQRADVNHTQGQTNAFLTPEQKQTKYVLMLPNDNTEENARIMVPNELNLASVESLMTGTIVDVANYLPENNNLSYALTDQPRKWYYTQISSLTNIAQEGAAPVYVKQSPWSQQILGGQQIIADDQPPLANIFLVRRALGEQVDEGNELNGYINTTYDLMVEWEDNVEVARNAIISSSGQVLVQNTGAVSVLPGLFFPDIDSVSYSLNAVDVNDNDAEEEATIDVLIPNLSIIDIQEVSDGRNVITELDQDLDEGNIRFERNRYGEWESIEGLTGGVLTSLFPIDVGQTITSGGVFAGANTIQLHDANGNAVATLDAQTAELTILPAYQSTMETRVSFAQHIPVLQLIDTTTDTALFAMHIPSKELANSQGIQLLNGNYALVPIQDTFVGEFAGGYCVQNPSEVCELYISEEGTIYAPEPYNSSYQATYAFDQTKNSVIYTVSSLQGVPVVSLNFIAEPLTQ